MRRLKKLGVCLSMAIVGAIIMAVPASAKEKFNDFRDSYTEPVVYSSGNYSKEQERELMNVCRVNDPSDWFMDDYIKEYVEDYIEDYYVGDLGSLNRFSIESFTADKNNNVFNYGVYIFDERSYQSWYKFICKCSDSDFEALKAYWSNVNGFETISDHSFKTHVYNNYGEFNGEIDYDPETNVVTIDCYR